MTKRRKTKKPSRDSNAWPCFLKSELRLGPYSQHVYFSYRDQRTAEQWPSRRPRFDSSRRRTSTTRSRRTWRLLTLTGSWRHRKPPEATKTSPSKRSSAGNPLDKLSRKRSKSKNWRGAVAKWSKALQLRDKIKQKKKTKDHRFTGSPPPPWQTK